MSSNVAATSSSVIDAPTLESDLLPFAEIQSAVACYPKKTNSLVMASIRSVMKPRLTSSQSNEWNSSTLTGSGLPFELSFTTCDSEFRCTLEPGCSGSSGLQRINYASQIVRNAPSAANDTYLQADVLDTLCEMSKCSKQLTYGAWIGLRHNGEDEHRKIYLELGQESAHRFKSWLSTNSISCFENCGVKARPRMVGVTPSTDTLEVYYRLSAVRLRHFPQLFDEITNGEASFIKNIRNTIESAYGYPITDKLPGGVHGLSMSVNVQSSRIVAMTLYFIARSVWGSDAGIRRNYLALTQGQQDNTMYAAVSRNVSKRTNANTHHGMLGLTVTKNGSLHWGIGIRPIGITNTG